MIDPIDPMCPSAAAGLQVLTAAPLLLPEKRP
jgi:hypothetical protein